MVRKRLFLVSLVLVVALGVSLTAGADARGGGSGTTTPSIELLRPATLGPTLSAWPKLGDKVDFSVVYGNVRNPRIEVLCYQPTDPSKLAMKTPNGYLVYGEARGATPDQGDYVGLNPFVLGGGMSAWKLNGGTASCTANLFYFGKSAGQQTYNKLASDYFTGFGN